MKLADLYDNRNMFAEAAKHAANAADMASTFNEKIKAYMRETELWIKASQYDRAEESSRKALASGSTREKFEMKKSIKDLYKKHASDYEKAGKNTSALKVYLKLLELSDESEKKETKLKILGLYERLGKIREYTLLRDQIG